MAANAFFLFSLLLTTFKTLLLFHLLHYRLVIWQYCSLYIPSQSYGLIFFKTHYNI